jgi:RHS repeat-associated protein
MGCLKLDSPFLKLKEVHYLLNGIIYSITYDNICNPLTYDGYNFTWEMGRQLKSINGNGKAISYKYNDSGIRTEKTVDEVTTNYKLVGDKVTFETNGSDKIYYTYDTWGKLISIEGTLKDSVGVKNPYRYRGYRHDTETGLYYLQSRYYNPEWGRFINADEYIGEVGTLLSSNMFAYCLNNPVNLYDPSGSWFALTFPLIGTIAAVISSPIVIGVALAAATGLAVYAGYKHYQSTVADEALGEQSGPYSDIEDPPGVEAGKDFTASQKKKNY